MITEDYVSFEVAKLLKEKGFPQDPNICNTAYTVKGKFSNNAKSFAFYYELIKPRVYSTAPTLQMTMKWLREVHNLFIFPFPQMNTNKFWIEIFKLSDNKEWENLYYESIDLQDYPTYEGACEAGIKYCLENLI